MADRAAPKELSSDPGDLCRAYEEYIAALQAQLVALLHN
jgi:hypothetical protein